MTSKTVTIQLSDSDEHTGRAARRIYLNDATLKSLKCLAGDPAIIFSASFGEDANAARAYAVGSAWPSLDLEAEGSETSLSPLFPSVH